MKKSLYILILALVLIVLSIYFVGFLEPKKQDVKLVLSFSSPVQKNNSLDVLVTALSDDDKVVTAGRFIKYRLLDEEDKSLDSGLLQSLNKGVYSGKISVPNELISPNLILTLTPDIGISKDFYLNTENKPILALIPPNEIVFAGERVNFELMVADSASYKPIFKQPVRVKMYNDENLLIINRIVFTNTKGIANFSTYLDQTTPEGDYLFIFETSGNKVNVKLPIYSACSKPEMWINQFQKQTLGFIFPQFYNYTINNPKPSPYLKTINNAYANHIYNVKYWRNVKTIDSDKVGRNFISMSFRCAESSLKRVELWQNHHILHAFPFPMKNGQVNIPLRNELDEKHALKIKLWWFSNKKISYSEYVLPIIKEPYNDFTEFLAKMKLIVKPNECPLDTFIVSRKSKLLLPNNEDIKESDFSYQIDYDRINLSKCGELLPIQLPFRKRFIVLKDKFKVSNQHFRSILVHINPLSFWKSYLNSEYCQLTTLDSLLNNLISRMEIFEFSRNIDRKVEIEMLESLILPLYRKCYSYFSVKDKSSNIINEKLKYTINRLSSIIYVPNELLKLYTYSSDKISEENVSLSGIPISLKSLKSILIKTGNILVKYQNENVSLPVTKSILKKSSKLGNINEVENLRSVPVLLEFKAIPFF